MYAIRSYYGHSQPAKRPLLSILSTDTDPLKSMALIADKKRIDPGQQQTRTLLRNEIGQPVRRRLCHIKAQHLPQQSLELLAILCAHRYALGERHEWTHLLAVGELHRALEVCARSLDTASLSGGVV